MVRPLLLFFSTYLLHVFDTVDHSILTFNIAFKMGLVFVALLLIWFDFISPTSHSQAVLIQNSTSSFSYLSCGVHCTSRFRTWLPSFHPLYNPRSPRRTVHRSPERADHGSPGPCVTEAYGSPGMRTLDHWGVLTMGHWGVRTMSPLVPAS